MIISPYDFKKRLLFNELENILDRSINDYFLDNHHILEDLLENPSWKIMLDKYNAKLDT